MRSSLRVWRSSLGLPLIFGQQHSERSVFAPAADCEILVERQGICGFELVRETNQTGIRKINSSVPVFSQYLPNSSGFS